MNQSEQWFNQHFGQSEEFSPMPNYTASRQFFLDTFGGVMNAAIDAGTSTYAALMATPGGTRGWKLYFDDWKRRGLLS
jgi:hypothetical protein